MVRMWSYMVSIWSIIHGPYMTLSKHGIFPSRDFNTLGPTWSLVVSRWIHSIWNQNWTTNVHMWVIYEHMWSYMVHLCSYMVHLYSYMDHEWSYIVHVWMSMDHVWLCEITGYSRGEILTMIFLSTFSRPPVDCKSIWGNPRCSYSTCIQQKGRKALQLTYLQAPKPRFKTLFEKIYWGIGTAKLLVGHAIEGRFLVLSPFRRSWSGYHFWN